MKIVSKIIDQLTKKIQALRRDKAKPDAMEKRKSISILHERMNGLEKKLISSQKMVRSTQLPTDNFVEIELLLQDEIKSRERLERKLSKTTRRIDQLSAEFNVLQCQLKTSTVDLDLERRKNAELKKRLRNHPIRTERRMTSLKQ